MMSLTKSTNYKSVEEFVAHRDRVKEGLGLIKYRNKSTNNIALIKTEYCLSPRIKDIIKFKYCTKCSKYKSVDEFSKNSNTSENQEGLQGNCKKCNARQRDDMTVAIYKYVFPSVLGDYLVEYYGQTSQYETRINNHLSDLRNKRHANKELQREFNALVEKVGLEQAEQMIKFEIVEEIDREKKQALVEMSESQVDYMSKYLLHREKEIQDIRVEELKAKDLKVKVVSTQKKKATSIDKKSL